ncbi:MAG: CidA/LrgA family protein [Candidatus Puniceispirillaceae bacterium]
MFQLVGEAAQKVSGLPVPGPVIGLILMLSFLLFTKNNKSEDLETLRSQLILTSETLIKYLSLLFVPIGVGVVMHLQLLESQLIKVLAILLIGTISTIVFTAFIFLRLSRVNKDG